MQYLRLVGCGLVVVALAWLAVMTAFVWSGLQSGKVQDASAAILGIGVFGLVPALLLGLVGAVLVRRASAAAREEAPLRLEEALLERVQARGRLQFDEAARELRVSAEQIEQAVYAVTGKRLFTGYINWRGREMISADAGTLAGGKCPNCGGALEIVGKGTARCPYCGTETYQR